MHVRTQGADNEVRERFLVTFEAEIEEEPVSPGTIVRRCGSQLLEQRGLSASGRADDQHVAAAGGKVREQLACVSFGGYSHVAGAFVDAQKVAFDGDECRAEDRVHRGHVG